MSNFIFSALCFAVLTTCVVTTSRPLEGRAIRVGLHASWPATSAVAETAEWVASQSGETAFWAYVSRACALRVKQLDTQRGRPGDQPNLEDLVDPLCDRDAYAIALDALHGSPGSDVGHISGSIATWVLSASVMSPRVRVQETLAEESIQALGTSISGSSFAVVFIEKLYQVGVIFDVDVLLNELKWPCGSDHSLENVSGRFECGRKGDHGGKVLWHTMGRDLEDLIAPLPGEHSHPQLGTAPTCGNETQVILYSDPLSSDFNRWHTVLTDAAVSCRAVYILRFWRGAVSGAGTVSSPLRYSENPGLQGYEVKVQLKSTEYKVQDDVVYDVDLFSNCAFDDASCSADSAVRATRKSSALSVSTEHMLDIDSIRKKDDAALVSSDHLIRRARGDPMVAMSLMKNFAEQLPIALGDAYQELKLDDNDLVAERLNRLRRGATAARSIPNLAESIFVNGRRLLLSELTEDIAKPLACLNGVSKSAAILRSLGGNLRYKASSVVASVPDAGAQNLRVDILAGRLSEGVLIWFNDLATGRPYAQWRAVNDIEKPFADRVLNWDLDSNGADDEESYMRAQLGGLVSVRSNMLSLVAVLDLGNLEHLPYISVAGIAQGSLAPIRVGTVIVPTNRASTLCAGIYYYALAIGGQSLALSFLTTFQQVMEYYAANMGGAALSENLVENIYRHFRLSVKREDFAAQSAASILRDDSVVFESLTRARKWATFVGIVPQDEPAWDPRRAEADGIDSEIRGSSFNALCMLNGIVIEDVGANLLTHALSEQQRIAGLLDAGSLSPPSSPQEDTIVHWVFSDKSLLFVRKFDSGEAAGATDSSKRPSGGVGPSSRPHGISLVPLVLLASNRGIDALRTLVYKSTGTSVNTSLDTSLEAAAVTLWVLSREHDIPESALEILGELETGGFAARSPVRFGLVVADSPLGSLLWNQIGLDPFVGNCVFIVNGVIYSEEHIASGRDLELLVIKESIGYGRVARDVLGEKQSADDVLLASLAMKEVDGMCGGSELGAMGGPKLASLARIRKVMAKVGSFSEPLVVGDDVQGSAGQGDFRLSLVVDPVGSYAVYASSFVSTIVDCLGASNVDVEVFLLPAPKLPSEGPGALHAAFSKAVFSATPTFSEYGRIESPAATFASLPQDALLTVAVSPPRAWFVASFATSYDLDNVVLRDLPASVSILHAEYVLESLLVEGSCIDESYRPQQGLRLEMVRRHPTVQVDTLVMENLGYFQLKAPTPGRWVLDIARGRGRDMYSIESILQTPMFPGASRAPVFGKSSKFFSDESGRIVVVMNSLGGARNTVLQVRRKSQKESFQLLDPGSSPTPPGRAVLSGPRQKVGHLWRFFSGRRLKDAFGVNRRSPQSSRKDVRIHVFSVASGHLYERFLKIMMLSVVKHASVPVKFWLLENYLSPSFKKVIPYFASNHRFEVEMVTYRWPGWLREQSEKQRIIWAYKILFLDVLFPLNLSRVIFVDSDQVVRGDLAELMRLDLRGAPYGYTPFCDSRKEVEGFRFWKTGFWKDTLQGAKYRISALYVVDLDTFRETSAGDTLRFVYQSLSADPNSLSNLDQDLPNYASVAPIRGGQVVPIFDLPQEWLWCESWCDDESKARAKTIDLCNNPMTKEPKLDSAKRIVAEWVALDEEAFNSTNTLYATLGVRASGETLHAGSRPDKDHFGDMEVIAKDEL